MTKQNQLIFMEGKKKALERLFSGGENSVFGYLAIGYSSQDNGFEDPDAEGNVESNGFNELEAVNGYNERIPLQLQPNGVDEDSSTGKVLVRFFATLTEDIIKSSQEINQIAVVDSKDVRASNTKYYSATTFPTFTKSSESAITFVIGFRL